MSGAFLTCFIFYFNCRLEKVVEEVKTGIQTAPTQVGAVGGVIVREEGNEVLTMQKF